MADRVYSMTLWYGYYTFNNSVLSEKFFAWMYAMGQLYSSDIQLLFMDHPHVDVMYEIIKDVSYCKKNCHF